MSRAAGKMPTNMYRGGASMPIEGYDEIFKRFDDYPQPLPRVEHVDVDEC
jgi:hypothetical protein